MRISHLTASAVINLDLPWNPAVLEQRIGRVHRLGQHRPVRVVNFISEGTIEHNMLLVLKFKKSLFAGVLDNGEDSVSIGKSRLNKFMESIEEVTGAKTDHQSSVSEGKIPVPKGIAESSSKSAAGDYQELFAAGGTLLKILADVFSGPQTSDSQQKNNFVETDKETGKSYFKIPLPDKQIIQSALPVINYFVETLKRFAGHK